MVVEAPHHASRDAVRRIPDAGRIFFQRAIKTQAIILDWTRHPAANGDIPALSSISRGSDGYRTQFLHERVRVPDQYGAQAARPRANPRLPRRRQAAADR